MANKKFKPGDTAPMTGWYRVSHPSHDSLSEVIVAQSEVFPTCPECKICPTYELLAPLSYDFPRSRAKTAKTPNP